MNYCNDTAYFYRMITHLYNVFTTLKNTKQLLYKTNMISTFHINKLINVLNINNSFR